MIVLSSAAFPLICSSSSTILRILAESGESLDCDLACLLMSKQIRQSFEFSVDLLDAVNLTTIKYQTSTDTAFHIKNILFPTDLTLRGYSDAKLAKGVGEIIRVVFPIFLCLRINSLAVCFVVFCNQQRVIAS
jgi:hypothetical protein